MGRGNFLDMSIMSPLSSSASTRGVSKAHNEELEIVPEINSVMVIAKRPVRPRHMVLYRREVRIAE